MPRLLPIALMLSLSGCAAIYRSMTGEPDPDIAEVAQAAQQVLQCPAKNITAVNDGKHKPLEWSVDGCSRYAACTKLRDNWQCFSGPAPEWLGTDDEGPVLDMIDRLALETACPAAQIKTTATFVAAQMTTGEAVSAGLFGAPAGRRYSDRAKDRAFRFAACGRAYVCSQAEGRTDCKVALGQSQVVDEEPVRRRAPAPAEPVPEQKVEEPQKPADAPKKPLRGGY